MITFRFPPSKAKVALAICLQIMSQPNLASVRGAEIAGAAGQGREAWSCCVCTALDGKSPSRPWELKPVPGKLQSLCREVPKVVIFPWRGAAGLLVLTALWSNPLLSL